MIVVDRVRDLFDVLVDVECAKAVLDDVYQRGFALSTKNAAKCDVAQRLHARIDQNDVVELIWQLNIRPQVINRLAD